MDHARLDRRQLRSMEVMRLNRPRLYPFSKLSRWTWLCLALIGIGISAFYAVRFVRMVILMSSVVVDHRFIDDSTENGRGDKVTVFANLSGDWEKPETIVITLKRVHHWFSTTLLKAKSFGTRVDLKWQNDDTLDAKLDFGCAVQVSRPVTRVESLHISYHFTYYDKSLDPDLAHWAPNDRSACLRAHRSG